MNLAPKWRFSCQITISVLVFLHLKSITIQTKKECFETNDFPGVENLLASKMQEEETKVCKIAKKVTQEQIFDQLQPSLKTYQCEKCPKTFINSVAFGRHKRSHEKVIIPKNSRGAKLLEAAKLKKDDVKGNSQLVPEKLQSNRDHNFVTNSQKKVFPFDQGSSEVKVPKNKLVFNEGQTTMAEIQADQGAKDLNETHLKLKELQLVLIQIKVNLKL